MNKVHITLVGGQPAPVYYAIKNTNPDYIVYIYSHRSKKDLEMLKSEISIDSEEILLDPTDPNKIENCALKLAEKYAEDEVTVNITSGLKSWSYWFGVIFEKKPNATILYVDQNNNIWNYNTKELTQFDIDVNAQFRLYGNSIDNNYTDFKDYTQKDFDVIPEIEDIRNFDHDVFNHLTILLSNSQKNELRNKKGEGKFVYENSDLEWSKKNNKIKISVTKRNGKSRSITLTSEHIFDLVFNSGWFEVKVAKILSQWKKTKEIYLNCKFPLRAEVDKNEVDIIVNTGVKLLFVECKTQIKSSTDIDKFRSVIKTYGGMASKGLFITESKMSDLNEQKCEEHRIKPFSLTNDFLSPEQTIKLLFNMLDTEIDIINAR